ncbi:MAG: hypothetical protein M1835_000443, partial [Candelina submexicana]
MVVNLEHNDGKESACLSVLADEKYFHIGNSFLKRTLRKHEWPTSSSGKLIVPSPSYVHRWNNEAETLGFLRQCTKIPLPTFHCILKDDGALYFFTKFVDGVGMNELQPTQQAIVMKEVEEHVAALQSLRSEIPSGSNGPILCPPHRVFRNWRRHSTWKAKEELNFPDE